MKQPEQRPKKTKKKEIEITFQDRRIKVFEDDTGFSDSCTKVTEA